APMPAGTVFPTDVGCNLQDTALWMFHGEDDNNANLGAGVFSPCSMVGVEHMYNHPDLYPGSPSCVARVSEPGHPDGRMTMFYDVGHFAWVEAINPVGEGFPASEWASDQGCGIAADFRDYSAASDPDGIYSWFASLDRPDVAAPDDFEVSGDDGSTTITATVTDDDTITWTWTQTAGPAATLVDADTETLQVDDLAPLTQYTFEVLALDADGQWDRDEITIDVSAATVGGGSSSDGGVVTTDPGSTGVTDTVGSSVTETDATTGDASVTETDATTGVVTSVSDTDASTGVITSVSDTDATTGVVTSVSDTDATTGVITSVSDTDATTGVITSVSDTDATTGEASSGETGSGSTGTTAGTSSSEDSGSSATASTTMTTTVSTTDETSSGSDVTADGSSSTGGPADSGSGSMSGTLSGGDTDSQGSVTNADSESSGPGVIGEDAPDGCACSTDDRRPLAGAPWAMLLAFVVRPRRRRAS
ncbi:MAG: hypothetical protein IAG13_17745, partial [Deltaproteobacteria bacterium]|nr:hypothetical protein [Nannocystaceae bacterium]